MKFYRRSVFDDKWRQVKNEVICRDRNKDRLVSVLSLSEMNILRKHAGSKLNYLDPAHVFPVSTYPHMCYMVDNVVLLNRFSHEALDNCCCPLTGCSINRDEVSNWWRRIIGNELYEKLYTIAKNGGGGYGKSE